MQIGAACQHRQGLVRRIAAEISAQIERVLRGRKKFQIRAVGVIHQQQRAVPAADGREGGQLCPAAEIIGTREIDGGGLLVCQQRLQFFRRDAAGQRRAFFSVQPRDLQPQQRRARKENPVGVAPGGDQGLLPRQVRVLQRKIQHRADAQRRALGGIERFGAAEERGGVFLARADHAFGVVQHVCTGDFGDIQRLRSEQRDALVPRHMQAQGLARGVALHKINDWGIHSASPAVSAARATCSMMAHSMRLRKSSQPAS